MFTNFMTDLPMIQFAVTLGLGALVYYVKTVVREGQDKSEKQHNQLRLDITNQINKFEVQMASRSAESQQIHHDIERRVTSLEQFYRDINVQLGFLRQNTSNLLKRATPPEGQMGD